MVAFGAGWQVSKVSTPYYEAHPIIFEDKECPGELSSGGNGEELNQLKEEGIAERQEENKRAETSPAMGGGNVAGVVSKVTANGKFVGSVNSNLFHDPSCAASKRIKEANQIWFSSVDEARQAGYEPSQCTKDKLGMK